MLSTRAMRWSVAILVAGATPIAAQGLGSLRKKAEEAKKKVESAVDKKQAADTVKSKPAANTTSTPAAEPGTSSAEKVSASPQGGAADAAKPNAKVWENYDFVPGNKVLFYTDFSEDKVGNFARGLKYRSGPAEVIERDDVKVLRATGTAEFLIPVGKKLPERFTLEIDIIAPLSGVMNRASSRCSSAMSCTRRCCTCTSASKSRAIASWSAESPRSVPTRSDRRVSRSRCISC